MAELPEDGASWQAEADLLADGRDHLEKLTDSLRFRHLYPEGANQAVLLAAYQELWRERAVGRVRPRSRRRLLRRFKRVIRRRFFRDADERSKRLTWGYPAATPTRLTAPLPPLVEHALSTVDEDARDEVSRHIRGEEIEIVPSASATGVGPAPARLARGLTQLRRALINESLAHPAALPSLHPQYLRFARAPLPRKRRHPIANLVLVKAPLYLWLALLLVFNVAYLGAWWFFNDETLARFLGPTISPFIDGDLEFDSIHWQPRLIVDLITGTPTPVRVRGFRVYEGHTYLDLPQRRLTAEAEAVDAKLVLHEIIPWNRIGVVPPVFEIPWLLHFAEARTTGPVRLRVHQYAVENRRGETEWRLSLTGAFQPPNDDPGPLHTRGISFHVDDFRGDDVSIDVDFRTSGQWQTLLHLADAQLELDFLGPHPLEPPRQRLPLAFDIRAKVDDGRLDINALNYSIPLKDLDLERMWAGHDEVPFGDVALRGHGLFGGSPTDLDGLLADFMGEDPRADLSLVFDDLGPLAEIIVAAHELPASMVDAAGVAGILNIRGPLSDPTIGLAAASLTIHPDEAHPDWVIDDADLSVDLTRDPIPEPWEDRFEPGDERWMATLSRFDAVFLDGPIALREHAIPTRVLLPEGEDPGFLITADLDLGGVDPGLLLDDDPESAALIAGSLRGHLGVPALAVELGEEMVVTHAEADLDQLQLTRDAGPHSDGLPKTIKADGGLRYDASEGLGVDALAVSINGGRVEIDGGTDGDIASLRPTEVALRVSDGDAFLREFALDPYFDRLDARLTLSGPLGAPNGTGGALTLSGAGTGDVVISGIDRAKLWMDRGELKVRSPNIALLGGRGSLDADLNLFDKGELTGDPKLRVSADLSGVELDRVSGGAVRGAGDLQLEVGDAGGKALPISRFEARGALYVRALGIGDADFRDAEAKFDLDRERLHLGYLRLPYHRQVSPHIAPGVSIPTGELTGSGTIGFDQETTLDLDIGAWGLPLALFADAVEFTDPPFGGQIAAGTNLDVKGTLSQPAINGEVKLLALSASGIPLGQGALRLDSVDVAAGGGLAKRREVRLDGSFARRVKAKDPADRLQWTLSGLIAFGDKAKRASKTPFAAELVADFGNLPISNLLHGVEGGLRDTVAGQLEGATVRARICDPTTDLLAACRADKTRERGDFDVHVEMDLDRLWIHERGVTTEDPCAHETSLCSTTSLLATLDGSEIQIASPWTLRSGGAAGRELTITGDFDISEPPVDDIEALECRASSQRAALRAREVEGATSRLRGELALSALTPFVKPFGISGLSGKVDVDLAIRGHASDPVVAGNIDVPTTKVPLSLGLTAGDQPWSIDVPTLLVKIAGDHIFPSGTLKVRGQTVDFGDFSRDGGQSTYYTLAGPCAGNFAVAAQGSVDGKMIGDLLPDVFNRASGSIDISSLFVAGNASQELRVDSLRLTASPGADAFRGDLTLSEIEPFVLDRGLAQLVRCSAVDPCPDGLDGYAAYIGGRSGAAANSAPSTAMRLKIGDRGRATAWGHLVMSSELDRIIDSRLHVALDEVAYKQFDNSGRPELLATVSSEDVVLEGRDALILRGELLVERSRWIRDAQEGVKVLSFADPSTAPESPPPELIRDLQMDLRLRTTAPFRVDNNVMKGVEGQVAVAVGGTYSDLDLSGKIDVNTGILDLTILGSAFDIQYGKVTLEHDLDESRVDVLATRQEPIYIDGQPRQMSVRLSGTLDAINMQCIVQGDTRTRQRTTRECVDYLVLGAGSREVADTSGVRRTGGGGLLGKPIGLVGSLTELKLDRYVEESAPRIAPYVPDVSMRLGQYGIEVDAETPRPWFRSEWGNLSVGAGYTRGYPGLLLRNSYNWRVRFQLLDNATLELRDSKRSYFNERIIFDPLRQRSLELRIDHQLPSLR
ncbi:MAG: translocation/assembly module TamB domain-containing protein [Nannocystaceae bacterium]